MKKFLLYEMCRGDLKGRKFDLAVIPVGATEAHAWHLPFGNDTLHAAEVARRAAARAAEKGAGALVLPAIPFGCSPDVMSYPYTVTIRPTTLLRLLEDLINSLADHGIRKFVVLNGHGGNTGTIEALTRELFGKRGLFIAWIDWWTTVADVVRQVQETDELSHADEIETSQSLEICPELVRMDWAEKTHSNPTQLKKMKEYGGKFLSPWHLYTKNAGVGDPTKATREKGRKIVAAAGERIAAMLVELARAKHKGQYLY
ncbi:MAG: creatininase family protein [Kiritimatiellia bacterium]